MKQFIGKAVWFVFCWGLVAAVIYGSHRVMIEANEHQRNARIAERVMGDDMFDVVITTYRHKSGEVWLHHTNAIDIRDGGTVAVIQSLSDGRVIVVASDRFKDEWARHVEVKP